MIFCLRWTEKASEEKCDRESFNFLLFFNFSHLPPHSSFFSNQNSFEWIFILHNSLVFFLLLFNDFWAVNNKCKWIMMDFLSCTLSLFLSLAVSLLNFEEICPIPLLRSRFELQLQQFTSMLNNFEFETIKHLSQNKNRKEWKRFCEK